jgi:O-antigen/teichoic acid export membrane protein
VARNTFFSAVGEGSNLLLFLLGFLAARWLAPVAFGHYSAAFAYVGLFRLLPDFGMSYASTLEISRDRSLAGRLIGNLLGFQAVLSVATLALCIGIGALLFDGPTWTAVLVLSVDLILKSVKATLRFMLKAFESFGIEAASLLIERGLILGLGVAVLLAGHGLLGFVLVFAVVRSLETLGLAAYVHARVQKLEPAFDTGLWGELLRKGLPFAYAGAMIILFFQIDQVMLEQMRGAREVGFYGAPVRVLEGLTLIPRILGYALIPTMAALFPTSPDSVTSLYRRGSKYLLLAGLPIAAFGALASDRFIPFLFGAEYHASVPAAQLLLPAAVFMFLSNFGETTLACINRWTAIVVVSTVSVVLNVALNLMWIPRFGYVGAAWATLVTEAAYFLLTAAALFRYGHRIGWLSLLARPVVAAAVFALVLRAGAGLPLLAAAVAASAAYALATVLVRAWEPQEWSLLRGLVRELSGSVVSRRPPTA